MFFKMYVLKNLTIFQRETSVLESLFNKVVGLCYISKNSFFYRTPPVATSGKSKIWAKISFFNFILRWLAQVNKNQPLTIINVVKMYPVEAETKVISMLQLFAVEHTTLTSKQSKVVIFTECYIEIRFTVFSRLRQTVTKQTYTAP